MKNMGVHKLFGDGGRRYGDLRSVVYNIKKKAREEGNIGVYRRCI